MTITRTFIRKLKKQAKEQASLTGFSHSQLLDSYARELGYRTWKDLLSHQSSKPLGSETLLPEFRDRLLDTETRRNFKQSMVIDSAGGISVCYAAFDYINQSAKVALVGLTPGEQQALRANEAVAEQLSVGASDQEALKAAKVFASFSGPMRANLVALLDNIGLQSKLGIDSTDQLFGKRSDLCHFTSALRYPVFVENKNYSGSPSILKHPLLKKMVDDYLAKELSLLGTTAWYIPLGKESAQALRYLSEKGIIPEKRVLDGLPHPSGANAERIAYFLGRKERRALSWKTNPDALDKAKLKLMEKIIEDNAMDRNSSGAATTIPSRNSEQVTSSIKQETNSKNPIAKVVPGQIESGIIDVARRRNMTAIAGSKTRHELELRFRRAGGEESLYINRKSYWRKGKLKIALRPDLSEELSEEILKANCVAPLIFKGEQREAYSSNYKAFHNKREANGSKNEHFGHAWLVSIDCDLSGLSKFLEIVSQ